MDLQVQLYVLLQATPEAVVGWLHTLVELYDDLMPWPSTLIFGPHTHTSPTLTPFETVALYAVDKRASHDIAAREVVFSLTYMPLRHPKIGLDLRVWPLFPAALDTLKFHFSDYFTQASPVLSSAASLHFTQLMPTLACNRWFHEQVANPNYAEAEAAKALYPAWLEQYRALKGDYPVDPRRAFRDLLSRCRRSIE